MTRVHCSSYSVTLLSLNPRVTIVLKVNLMSVVFDGVVWAGLAMILAWPVCVVSVLELVFKSWSLCLYISALSASESWFPKVGCDGLLAFQSGIPSSVTSFFKAQMNLLPPISSASLHDKFLSSDVNLVFQ